MRNIQTQRGFSLIEFSLVLGLSGLMVGVVWQVLGSTTRATQQQLLATNALKVASAAQTYLQKNNSALLNLAALNSIGSVVRIRIIDSDTGSNAVPSVQGDGLLESSFVNQNNLGQAYALFLRREDGGAAGVDSDDRLSSMLITTGGSEITDALGSGIVSALGSPGGFIYKENNPSSPATLASGAAGGWSANLNTDWNMGAVATAGHIAILTNLIPYGGTAPVQSGANSIDALSDGYTDYVTRNNIYMGNNSGNIAATGTRNIALGVNAMPIVTTGSNNLAIGNLAARNLTTGNSNIGIGYQAFSSSLNNTNNTGEGSVAVGAYANTNVTAAQNSVTAIGAYALYQAQGDGTTSIGAYSLYYNTANAYGSTVVGAWSWIGGGVENAIVGAYTGQGAGGDYNAALGYGALRNANLANYNVALGYQSLGAATNASRNVAIGANALQSNLTKTDNVAIGYNAMALSHNSSTGTVATGNTVIGNAAMNIASSGTAQLNVSVGTSNLSNCSSCSMNVAIGAVAMNSGSSGTRNLAIGHQTALSNATKNDVTAVGTAAMSNTTSLGPTGSTYNTAFGYRSLITTATSFSVTGINNTAFGDSAMRVLTTGNGNTAFSNASLSNMGVNITTGNNNTLIGPSTYSNAAYDNSTALGYNARLTASNIIVLGDSSIGKISAQVTTITAISDARHKHDVADVALGLDFINQLRPVQYRLKDNPLARRYGFIAQEVEKVLPASLQNTVEAGDATHGLALLTREKEGERTYRMGYGELLAPLVKAVQQVDAQSLTAAHEETHATTELSNQLKSQQAQLEQLQEKLKQLEARQQAPKGVQP